MIATEERLSEIEKELRRTRRLVRWLLAVATLALAGWPLAWSLNSGTAAAQGQAPGVGEFRARAFIR